jgi:hypothetical protein
MKTGDRAIVRGSASRVDVVELIEKYTESADFKVGSFEWDVWTVLNSDRAKMTVDARIVYPGHEPRTFSPGMLVRFIEDREDITMRPRWYEIGVVVTAHPILSRHTYDVLLGETVVSNILSEDLECIDAG